MKNRFTLCVVVVLVSVAIILFLAQKEVQTDSQTSDQSQIMISDKDSSSSAMRSKKSSDSTSRKSVSPETKEKRLFSSFDMDDKTYEKWLKREKSYNDAVFSAILLNTFDADKDGKFSFREISKMVEALKGEEMVEGSKKTSSTPTLEVFVNGTTISATHNTLDLTGTDLVFSGGEISYGENANASAPFDVSVQTNPQSFSASPDDRRKALNDLYNRFDYDHENGFSGNKRAEMLQYVIDHYGEVGHALGDLSVDIKYGGLGL